MCHDNDCNDRNRNQQSNHRRHRDNFNNNNNFRDAQQHRDQDLNQFECLKMSMLDITEEAFQEMVKDKVKVLLQEKIGQKVDEIAEEIVDYYVKTKESELQHAKNADDLDRNLRKKL